MRRSTNIRVLVGALLVLAYSTGLMSGTATGASQDTIVSAKVLSSTFLDARTGCSSPQMNLGMVPPGSTVPTPDCTLIFGSSQGPTSLRISQTDGIGAAMSGQDSAGTLDPTFVGDGDTSDGAVLLETPSGDDISYVIDAAPRRGGGIYAGGLAGSDDHLIATTRTGGLDPTFNGTGWLSLPFEVSSITTLHNGDVLALGRSSRTLMRVRPDGTPNPDFDGSSGSGDGTVTLELPGTAKPSCTAVDATDRIYVGSAHGTNTIITRLHDDGRTDSSYGTNGHATVPIHMQFSGLTPYSMGDCIVDADGRLVVVGRVNAGTHFDMRVMRLTTAGVPDPSFSGGTRDIDWAGNESDHAHAVAQMPSGSYVIAGRFHGSGSGSDGYGVAMLLENGTLDPDFDGDEGTGNGKVAFDQTGPAKGFTSIHVHGTSITLAGWDNYWTNSYVYRIDATGRSNSDFPNPRVLNAGQSFLVGAAVATDDGSITFVGIAEDATWDYRFAMYKFAGAPINDYVNDGTRDFETVGSLDAFGVCLKNTGGGATATWIPHTTCSTAVDGAHWQGVPQAPNEIAAAPNPGIAHTATLRFGLRTRDNQPPGSYVAPITFSVVAT
ncbi:MAG: hypothetical protein ABI200_00560 [Gaiellales bacterium]